MQDKELYEQILGLKAPWHVSDVDLRMEEVQGHGTTRACALGPISVP
jgi:hypothetical protein